jgi:hypothetical protein
LHHSSRMPRRSHHSKALAFSLQSDTKIEQLLPTSGLVPAAKRTESGGNARLPRTHTLDVDSLDISHAPARQPLSLRAEWRIDRPTHKVSSLPSHIRYGTKVGKRLVTVTNHQASGEPDSREVPIDPDNSHSPQALIERPLGGVRQDKDRMNCDRAASLQPAAVNKFTRSQATRRISPRSKNDSADKPSRTVPVQVWVSPVVKAELSRLASQDGLSLSSAGAAFLARGIQQNVDMQYGALLSPIIEKAIARQMAGLTTRLTWLLVRIAFDAGQTRSLVTNILGRQAGVTQPVLKTLMDSSNRSAKANIMRRTPQITELISSVEQWMTEDNKGVSDKKI